MAGGRQREEQGSIVLRDVAFGHGHALLLARVTCSIDPGEHVAIVGRSGVGKSTLLQLIAGLLAPNTGSVWVNGTIANGRSANGAVLMFQRPALLPWLSTVENILLPLRFSGEARRNPAAARAKAQHLIEQVGLADRAAALPTHLSGGQQQRVALARALAGNPSILLLDEPFSALDQETRAALRSDVRRLAQAHSTTLVTVTHDHADAVALADRAILLAGQPATIKDDIALGPEAEQQLRLKLASPRNAA